MNMLSYLFDSDSIEPGGLSSPTSPLPGSEDRSLWANLPQPLQAEKLQSLSSRVGQLNLVVAAVVRSLVKQGLIKPAELSQLMKEIDLEDGKADGRLGEKLPDTPEWCPKCNARVQPGKCFCVFCGHRFDQSETGPDTSNRTSTEPEWSR